MIRVENTAVWVTIAVYILAMMVVGIYSGRKSKSIADFTVGGRNAGAWLSALSYGTAYFSAVMFVGYAGARGCNTACGGSRQGSATRFSAPGLRGGCWRAERATFPPG